MAVVFFSYSHADADLRQQLDKHLAPLRRQELAEGWHDCQILAGDELDPTITANLDRADVILLLVSADFINSDYCYSNEMTRALERHSSGHARIVPVILRPCDWQHPPISTLLATPKDGRPVTSWSNIDEAFTDVAKEVRRAVEDMNRRRKNVATEPSSPATAASATIGMQEQGQEAATRRVSLAHPVNGLNRLYQGLPQVLREFSDFERDEFVHRAFELIAEQFQAWLHQIVEQDASIKGRFQRIDARRFTTIIYVSGKSAAECTVRIDTMGGRTPHLAFAHSATATEGSSNEMLLIEHNGKELYFKPLGFATFGRDSNTPMSESNAASYLWELLLSSLR